VTKVSLAVGGLPVTFVADSNYWPPAGGGGGTYATFNGTPSAGVVMSNGNLTATHSTTGGNIGVASLTAFTTGKYYFEIVSQVLVGAGGHVGLKSSTNPSFGGTAMQAVLSVVPGAGNDIFSSGVNTGKDAGGTAAVGGVFGFAVDLTARLGWVRYSNGDWNGEAAANPATGTGGVTLPPTDAVVPAVRFASGVSTDALTANFGASAFSGAVPAGFTSGWTA
jgi:hypothetical protein